MSNAVHAIIESLNREYQREYNPIESDMIQRAKQLGLSARDVEFDEKRQEFYIEYPITTISREEEKYYSDLYAAELEKRNDWIEYDIRDENNRHTDGFRKWLRDAGAIKWVGKYRYKVNFYLWEKYKKSMRIK